MSRIKKISEEGRNMRLRELAAGLKVRMQRPLCLSFRGAQILEHRLNRVQVWRNCTEETLRRLKQDSGYIEDCLQQARERGVHWLPADRSGVRMLLLARVLVADGRERLTLKDIQAGVGSFDAVQMLTMRELELLSRALMIALCEALSRLCREALEEVHLRHRAERWVQGEGRIPGKNCAAFFEHALQLAAEMEKPELRAKIEKMIERRSERAALMVARVHQACADRCMRLENLMELRRLLQTTDWRAVFEKISASELELREDPAEIYPQMDAPSRAEVRRAVEELSHALRLDELSVVRYALRQARNALEAHGRQDPRATVCWYLLEDEGRKMLCASLGCSCRPRKRIPDPKGNRTAVLLSGIVIFLFILLAAVMERSLLVIYALPLAWVLGMQLVGRFYPRWLKPGRIVKLKLDKVPDEARILVVLPVLLSSADRAREMAAHMHALGCLERDENIDFLLLGDFRDGDMQNLPDDDEIITAARTAVAQLNAEGIRRKYYYLHRERSFRKADERWMGENRKRGALMALNKLLLDHNGAQLAFAAEGSCTMELAGRYRYVLTLDADTEYLPGDVHRLIGAIHHPLNRPCMLDGKRRGYAVLQPNMQLMAESCTNLYVQLTSGRGGVDCYPVSVSDFYQDMTGRGNFAGKGIYDVHAFAQATEGVLKDEEILSHDLIEGILSGAGYLNDVHFYDGSPASLQTDLVRLHRWTRGDWQLLPVIFSRLPICALDRMKMLGNLLRSLYAPALLGLLIHAVWMDAPMAFALGLLVTFSGPVMQLPRVKKIEWKAALLHLAVLPAETACMLDAVLRTLWRLAVSHKHLMDWIPAADAGMCGSNVRLPGRLAAILLLPGLLRPFWLPAVLALGILFFIGADWARDLADTPLDDRETIREADRSFLMDLAKRTWSFFERYVPEDGCGLPPDNVQMDPPVGEAKRTSPTNIGLYLMSCIAARELGFIDEDVMLRRIGTTMDTLEGLEKWNGQLYNWYDTVSFLPLKPRYVSAVDSGNLAGALLMCAHAPRMDAKLAVRMLKLAREMNLAALYDEERKLFRIGMDVESGRMSESHYDLYASEARILSYAAMMLGQVPVEHWKHLSRASVCLDKAQALISWSGTMFEYMMPELLFRSLSNTLAGQSRRGALACQMAWGKQLERPWGVSESGYYAFDLHLNYQYRAFGMRELALSGNAVQDVIAPYGTALALAENPSAAIDNLRRMCEMGWDGEFGMYEAADYMHLEAGRRPRLVRSYMAHHQGMSLCAMCNALKKDVLSRCFMEIPQARALRLLLQEREAEKLPGKGWKHRKRNYREPVLRRTDYGRSVRRTDCAADAHLLCGGGTTLLVNSRGGMFAWRENVQFNRFSGDMQNRHEGMYIHLEDKQTGKSTIVGSEGRLSFEPGCVLCRQDFGSLRIHVSMSVSPEDGSIYQRVEIENTGEAEQEFAVSGCMAVALAPENDMRAHPVFQNLFVESVYPDEGTLLFRRRRRDGKEPLPELVYLLAGDGKVEFETDYEKLVGRTGSIGVPGGLHKFTGTSGCVLNPCGALRLTKRLAGGEKTRLHFALALAEPDERKARIDRMRRKDAPERALQLASNQMRAVMDHAGIDAKRFRLYQRLGTILFDGRLRTSVLGNDDACGSTPQNLLWRAGISGDLPILLVEFEDGNLDCVREGMHLHAFWRLMGIRTDLVLINNHGNDYYQAARGKVGDLLASSHLNGSFNMPGGVFVVEGQNLTGETHQAIRRAAAVRLNGDGDPLTMLRAQLDGIFISETQELRPMKPVPAQLDGKLKYFNGYGGFDEDGYQMLVKRGQLPPAPWSNVLASEQAGAVVTDRGGGFAWCMNSRSGRLTPFANDVLREGWGWMFYLVDEGRGGWMRLLPGDLPMTDFIVRHSPGESCWRGCGEDIRFEVRMRAARSGVEFEVHICNEGSSARKLRLAGFVDWLMGTDAKDAGMLRSWSHQGACFASGSMDGVGCFVCNDPRGRTGCSRQALFSGGDMMIPRGLRDISIAQGGWTLHVPLQLKHGESCNCRFLLACGRDASGAYAQAQAFRTGEMTEEFREDWQERMDALRIHTPDEALNLLANGFLQAQTLNGRIRARTGLYQPGGAFGFRDQLQDMLSMIHYEPQRVRTHLLYCAARQFEAGDVLHWWHEPYSGVRTKIRDDLLFLPYVAAKYVQITGDEDVLWDSAPFLENIEIPDGKEDIYAAMRPAAHCTTLHDHCMRAFRRAAQTGEHGLCLMGAGDWNDGMNRVGMEGRGESVWLSEFLAVCAEEYARVAPNPEDHAWLMELNERMKAAVEKHCWDGKWYLRAFGDDGTRLGSREGSCCRIDLISQAWAVLAGLNEARCKSAMDAAWEQLADEKLKMIRLLTPPFDGREFDPGYIAAYPGGIRENGAQYTHAACWMLYALAEMGDAKRAHRALEMLLPVNHALDKTSAEIYRVEPYVMAADIYTHADHAGRGGWTWYTGSAAWMLMAVLKLLGYERKGNQVRLNALLGEWEEVSLELCWGSSSYRLVCKKDAREVVLDGKAMREASITLTDDGQAHTAVFPPRRGETDD